MGSTPNFQPSDARANFQTLLSTRLGWELVAAQVGWELWRKDLLNRLRGCLPDKRVPDLHRKVRPIADERVGTPRQESLHIRAFVDRPDLNEDAGPMRLTDEPRRNNTKPAGAFGDLVRPIRRAPDRPGGPRAVQRKPHFGRAGAGRHPG